MRGFFSALQMFGAFFLTIFGLALAFGSGSNQGSIFLGAFVGAIGLTFLALLAVNLRKAR